ncbi:MAG: SAM-dependent methyltransferase [Gammaproteobacteria bacterium]|nr:SAM-dependent methyltransferase [Gammaproteobacteria bacterium]
MHDDDNHIIQSWHTNAKPWVNAVREQQIESRRAVTDRAIVDAIKAHAPATVLDVGCGEGWLARALTEYGMQVTGVDVVPELIAAARQAGGGDFHELAYDALAAHPFPYRFDAMVCNFSLLGGQSTESVFRAATQLLTPGGLMFVQTLHPETAGGDQPYVDGWRPGSWQGFQPALREQFRDPAPWYFRTLASWQDLFVDGRLTLIETQTPVRSAGSQPVSVIFVAKC